MDVGLKKILDDFQEAMMELRCEECEGTGSLGQAPDGRERACETCGGNEDSLGTGLAIDVNWNDNPIRARLEGE